MVVCLVWVFILFFIGAKSFGFWPVNIAALLVVAFGLKYTFDNKSK